MIRPGADVLPLVCATVPGAWERFSGTSEVVAGYDRRVGVGLMNARPSVTEAGAAVVGELENAESS